MADAADQCEGFGTGAGWRHTQQRLTCTNRNETLSTRPSAAARFFDALKAMHRAARVVMLSRGEILEALGHHGC